MNKVMREIIAKINSRINKNLATKSESLEDWYTKGVKESTEELNSKFTQYGPRE